MLRCCADEVNALVLDVGSLYVKGGYAGDDVPKAIFPSVRPARRRVSGRLQDVARTASAPRVLHGPAPASPCSVLYPARPHSSCLLHSQRTVRTAASASRSSTHAIALPQVMGVGGKEAETQDGANDAVAMDGDDGDDGAQPLLLFPPVRLRICQHLQKNMKHASVPTHIVRQYCGRGCTRRRWCSGNHAAVPRPKRAAAGIG